MQAEDSVQMLNEGSKIIMTLLILSAVAILLARFIKKRKLTKLINEFMLEEKQQPKEEEKEADSQADSEKGKDHD